MTRETFPVQLTFEELGNLLIASGKADTSTFTNGAVSALRRGQFKLRNAVRPDLQLELNEAESQSRVVEASLLAAAAAELLAAARFTVAAINGGGAGPVAVAQLDAAIAKAEGRAEKPQL